MSQTNLETAIAHHKAGRLDEAAALYRKILATDPDSADANHLLGLIAFQRDHHEEALEYSKERVVQGGPLASKQLTQEKLVFMLTEITKSQLLALQIGRIKDSGSLHHTMVSMAKRNNVEVGLDTARVVRDMLGANGISLEYQTGRHMLNLESVITYEGTHDIHTLAIGEALTGLPAYR